ncbi:MAG TPA: deaminase [Candidatus Limnocylindrales bacterium]|nr:deaminase [Candidatus Limnocylindrales bacterium]
MNQDAEFLKQAIENSKRSMDAGNFPAGGVVVKNGEILASEVSSPFPNLFHADSKAVSKAFEKTGPLNGATLYAGLESCLMCTGAAYWSGIRRIIYAIPKSKVPGNYYETPENTIDLISTFNEKMELIHLSEFEDEALEVIKAWERNNL